jgi:hypothetical protein
MDSEDIKKAILSKTRSFEGEYSYLPENSKTTKHLCLMTHKTRKQSIFEEMAKHNDNPGPNKYHPDKLKLLRCSTASSFSKADPGRTGLFDPINPDFPDAGFYHVKRDFVTSRKL